MGRYGHVTALAGIDLDVAAGQFLVLLGPSGSGKSTLVRSIAGVERLDGGTLRLAGRLVSDGRRHLAPEHRDLAMVFQDYALWPHLTVQDAVAYALRRRRLPGPESSRRVHDALEQVGLAAMASRYPHELSGGEQQRAALARAIVRPTRVAAVRRAAVQPGRRPARAAPRRSCEPGHSSAERVRGVPVSVTCRGPTWLAGRTREQAAGSRCPLTHAARRCAVRFTPVSRAVPPT